MITHWCCLLGQQSRSLQAKKRGCAKTVELKVLILFNLLYEVQPLSEKRQHGIKTMLHDYKRSS
jgi:hypothetical protein